MPGARLQQPVKHQRRNLGVGAGPVRLAVVNPEMPRQRRQVVLRQRGQKYGRQIPGIVAAVGQRQPVRTQKAQVKRHIVADDGQVAHEIGELPRHLVKGGRPLNLRRRDVRQLLDECRNPPPGIHECLVAAQHLAAPNPHRPQLYDGVRVGVQPRSFQVNADELLRKGVVLRHRRLCHQQRLGGHRRIRTCTGFAELGQRQERMR